MTSEAIIGIDLGTTNSEVAIVKHGEVRVVEEDGTGIVPSCVGLDPEGNLLTGQAARNQYALRPEATVRSIKRKMGTGERIKLGDTEYTPPEISAIILTALKKRAEAELGHPVRRAVITVPAYFTDAQRQATHEAGELAGFVVERLLNEPTAAAFAYEMGKGASRKKTILVYDLGGGTFDVSILRMEGELVEVLATHGNTQLGGDDIDELLFKKALEAFKEKHPKAEPSPAGLLRLKLDAEKLKVALSEQASASLINMAIPLTDGNSVSFDWPVTRRDFEQWTSELFDGTLDSVHAALKAAKLSAKDLDEIVLVGGSTRTPYVAEMLESELGQRPRSDIHPEMAVAYGAGVMAARLMGESQHRILVDITPYTFGISCVGTFSDGTYGHNRFAPIIKAGTPLPCSRGQSFFTGVDGQQRVIVEVYQGENERADKNTLVGHFEIVELDKKAPAGSESFVNMKLDLDGILTITAIEKHTGFTKSVVMKDAFAKPDEEELAQRKAKVALLFGEKPEDESTTAETPQENQHDRTIEQLNRRIERCRGKLDQEDLDEIEQFMQKLGQAIDQGNADEAEQVQQTIDNILFFAESAQ